MIGWFKAATGVKAGVTNIKNSMQNATSHRQRKVALTGLFLVADKCLTLSVNNNKRNHY
jgi:hypothetical protein